MNSPPSEKLRKAAVAKGSIHGSFLSFHLGSQKVALKRRGAADFRVGRIRLPLLGLYPPLRFLITRADAGWEG